MPPPEYSLKFLFFFQFRDFWFLIKNQKLFQTGRAAKSAKSARLLLYFPPHTVPFESIWHPLWLWHAGLGTVTSADHPWVGTGRTVGIPVGICTHGSSIYITQVITDPGMNIVITLLVGHKYPDGSIWVFTFISYKYCRNEGETVHIT